MSRLSNLLLIFFLFFLSLGTGWAQSVVEIEKVEGVTKRIEKALSFEVDFKKDTAGLHAHLKPLLDYANKEHDIPLKWAYYMLMADGFSIAFDQVNARTDSYFKAADQLMKSDDFPELKMIGFIRQGYYYYTYRHVKEAFPFFLQANDQHQQIEVKKVPKIVDHFKFIASFYSFIGDQERAITYLKEALPFTDPISRQRIDMINSIAVYFKKDSLNDEAFNYYNQALHVAKLAKDSVWIGIVAGNLSDFEWAKGNKEKAITLVKQNIASSLKYNEVLDAMRANLILANMYIDQKQFDLANQSVQASLALMEDKPYFLKFKMDAAMILSLIAKGKGNEREELKQLNQFLIFQDSLEQRSSNEEMQRISWQWETERYDQAIREAEAKRNQIKQTYQYIGIFIILLFIIVLLLINRSKTRIKIRTTILEKEQMALALEKQQVDQEIILLRDSLDEFTNTIKRNDATIQKLRRDVAGGVIPDSSYQSQISDNLNAMLETHIMTDDRWLKFKHVFEKVYPDYLNEQKEANPKLSENDLRLIALLKLDLSNRSMSDLLGVSIEGIKKAKQRLKKKIEKEI